MRRAAFAFSPKLIKNRDIGAAFELDLQKPARPMRAVSQNMLALGWGSKSSGSRARVFAAKHGLGFLLLEDGFISYLGHPAFSPRLSYIGDRQGLYYDVKAPNDLKDMLDHPEDWMTDALKRRADDLVRRLRDLSISKYAHLSPGILDFKMAGQKPVKKAPKKPRILVMIDQAFDDPAVRLASQGQKDFSRMIEAALKQAGGAEIFALPDPDMLVSGKKGYLSEMILPQKITALTTISPQQFLSTYAGQEALLDCYTVNAAFGFEALLKGCAVHVFGHAFYGGRGLTQDYTEASPLPQPALRPVDLSILAAAALIRYPRYVDPFLGDNCEIETILDYHEAEKAIKRPWDRGADCILLRLGGAGHPEGESPDRENIEANTAHMPLSEGRADTDPRLFEKGERAFAIGFSLWKRAFLPAFFMPLFYLPGGLIFAGPRAFETIKWRQGDKVIVWGQKFTDQCASLPDFVELWRLEDGFLRSKGLGSDLSRPASLVFDRRGLYYDARQPSDLEHFLQNHPFSERALRRAQNLIEALRQSRLSKYNVGRKQILDFKDKAKGREIILVPGQVEDDASLACGAFGVHKNADLLRAVRLRAPEAYLIYKPHPDVLAANRKGGAAADFMGLADEWLLDIDIADCLDAVDSVHTMTSLTGFEALLRGKNVTVYGQPFYAGWGLTTDVIPFTDGRRGRQLSLEALVYGLLCVYARYVRWPTGRVSSAEAIMRYLMEGAPSKSVQAVGVMGKLNRLIRKSVFLFSAFLR